MALRFALTATDGRARRGRLETARGAVETPAFMPVGTAATVKALTPAMVAAAGAQMVLANTYHLALRPGAERVARLGGLHAFMRWPGPILTDSGGYQAMSLGGLAKVGEDGVRFRSHIDGARLDLTPERAVEAQYLLDSDVAMALDECTPWPIDKAGAAQSMRRSMRWAERCRAAFRERAGYGLFGIVQGGVHGDLRAESAERLARVGFDGYAVGGLAVGEGQAAMFGVLDTVPDALPADRPRYLMGVGKPADIVGAAARGIDLFDCVLPTRSGRTAQAWTREGPVNLRNARHAEDPAPLDPRLDCPASREFSRAYLHHLVKRREMLGATLLSWHNTAFYQALMAEIRAAIEQGRFAAWRREFEAAQGAAGRSGA